MMEDRYYVQRLTEQVFLIRERMSAEGGPGADDLEPHALAADGPESGAGRRGADALNRLQRGQNLFMDQT